jgi:hypothetical protein
VLDVLEPGDVGERLRNGGQLLLGARQRLLVDVADVHFRTMLGERARHHAADAACAGGDQHAQSFGGEFHDAA